MALLFAHRVGIDRGRGELRMAQPALHEVEGTYGIAVISPFWNVSKV